MANVLVPLFFFLFLAAVTLTPLLLTERRRRLQLELAREALVRGQPLDPRVLDGLDSKSDPRRSARRNLIPGSLLTFLALGLAAASRVVAAPADEVSGLVTAALIVGSVGLGFLVLVAFDLAAARRDAP